MRRCVVALAALLFAGAAVAQQVPAIQYNSHTSVTMPPGNNTNRNATTAFVTQAFSGILGTLTGDCTASGTVITCTKTNGVSFGVFATGTSAASLTGTLNGAQHPALSGDVTTGANSCGTTLASGSASVLNSGT